MSITIFSCYVGQGLLWLSDYIDSGVLHLHVFQTKFFGYILSCLHTEYQNATFNLWASTKCRAVQCQILFLCQLDLVQSEQWKKKSQGNHYVFSMAAYSYSGCTLLSWQSLAVTFYLPFMKQTGLMESKSLSPSEIIERAVFQSAALQENSWSPSSESLCSFLRRNTRGSFQNKMPNICSMLDTKPPLFMWWEIPEDIIIVIIALLRTRIDPTQARL